VARGSGEPGALIKSIQRAVWRVNKNQVLDRPTTVARLKADSMVGRRLPTMLLSGFAVLAMLLACAGIYGVLSFVTANRTQELGIRAALGASRSDLLRTVLGGGLMPVVAGIVVGLGGAFGLSRYIQSLLFQTSPVDVPERSPWARSSSSLPWPPAFSRRGARRIDPMLALRQE
jgi:putative ABC transport system permease protein